MFKKSPLFLAGFALLTAHSLVADERKPDSDAAAARQIQQIQTAPFASAEGKKIADSMADFGFHLHNAVSKAGVDTTTSPFSLTSAFGLVVNGARNATYHEVVRGLRLEEVSLDSFNQGYAALTAALKNISKDNVLSFGNAVFADLDFKVNASYNERVHKYMGATASNVNFRKGEEAAEKINAYIEGKTNSMIKKMVDADAVENWRAALVNAGYFKGAWAFKFDTKRTAENTDFNTGTAIKKVPMMRQRGKTFLYYQGKDFQMASLAYKNGDFTMDLIVPNRASDPVAALSAVQSQITGESYRQWIAASRATRIHLGLPRFKTSYKAELKPYFGRVMPLTFSDHSDLLGLSDEPVKLDAVIHATELKVNEEGTEGAFATVIGAVTTTAVRPPVELPEVIADRPFMMVIRHTATGTPVFISSISDPQALPKP